MVTPVHARFLRGSQIDPMIDMDKLRRKAVTEIEAIRLCFPDVRSEQIQICMGAWMSTLCAVDDILEEMDPPAAKVVLRQSIEIVLGQKETDHQVYQTPTENQVAFIMAKFRNHCSHYLAVPVAEDYRQGRGLQNDLHTYLQIRTHTIGIAPLFALVRHLYCPENLRQAVFFDLQRAVSLAAGLQNDLIGLEKDLHNHESMNAVAVALRGMGKDASDQAALREATCSVLRIHNQCSKRIFMMLEGWNMMGSSGITNEVLCGQVIAAFAESHMKWCSSSERYQLTID
ncbi:hypothetical protein FE257_000097 [Aspergillus nanangensis]|uniref:Uncharacterized protein n=1 Tax=Aspergillus nanangensis TaxID=2582783 RepID=A0AAD4GZX4_ASPNN|nr:hypothetical protein FE257_000097 [Aspergillus nanangensis]